MKIVSNRIKCTRCNLEFEFDRKDIVSETDKNLKGKKLIYVKCDVCKEKLYINKKESK